MASDTWWADGHSSYKYQDAHSSHFGCSPNTLDTVQTDGLQGESRYTHLKNRATKYKNQNILV